LFGYTDTASAAFEIRKGIIRMENGQNAMAYENIRLQDTIALARQQLDKARNQNEETKESIIQAKKELREDTAHSIGNL